MPEPKTLYDLIQETLNEKFVGKYFKWGYAEGWIRAILLPIEETKEKDYVLHIAYTSKYVNDYITIENYEEALKFGVDGHFTFTQKDEGKWWLMECLKDWKIYDSEEEMQKANLKNEKQNETPSPYILLANNNKCLEEAKEALDEVQIPYRVAWTNDPVVGDIQLISGLTNISGIERILAIASRNKKRKQLSENTK